jgi:hypothetical protein
LESRFILYAGKIWVQLICFDFFSSDFTLFPLVSIDVAAMSLAAVSVPEVKKMVQRKMIKA